jgi:hypothetical protein
MYRTPHPTSPLLAACLAALCRGQEPAKPQVPPSLSEVGAAYAAKIIASAVFVSGRTVESVLAEEFAPDTAVETLLRPLLRVDVDKSARTVSVSVLGTRRTAVFREGLGCTLALARSPAELREEAKDFGTEKRASTAWPAVAESDADGGLKRAVAAAFANPKARTRAVVVVRDGRIVGERYADGFTADTPLAGWSMTKSITHALVGIRVGQGKLELEAQPGLV